MIDNYPRLFVGGLMKSGTSLLRVLLSYHPFIFGGLETHWFDESFYIDASQALGFRLEMFSRFYDISQADVLRIASANASGLDLLYSLLNYCACASNCKSWVEKTPDNFRHIDKILSFDDSSIVFLVLRSPLDIYSSWKVNNKGDINEFISSYSDFNIVLNCYSSNSRVFSINYEQLVLQTQKTMALVYEYGGYPSIDVSKFSGDSFAKEKVMSILGKESPTADSLSKPVFSSSINQYKHILTKSEIKYITDNV